ncbi:MAG: NUDIX hydrolase [Nitrososphaerota archaeon]|nr:NUDIX hydrolase [Candidatus Bathyarchaeota archaeon]MDW8023983.1 NUDIX hydrolase [Nitrososphaerota archaeon]
MVRRLYPDQPVVGVGAIIVCNGKILLEKRRSDPGRGKWSVPGGIVELGESPENAVVREVKEETGLEVDNPELVDVVNNIILDEDGKIQYHFVIVDYFVKLRGGELRAADDAEELRWVNLEEAEKYNITDTLRAFLKRNMEKLKTLNSCY